MSFEDIKKLDDTYVMHTYGNRPRQGCNLL